MLEKKTKVINGHNYEVTQLPYKRGRKLFLRLYKALGPVLAEALANAPVDGKVGQLQEMKVSKLLPSMTAVIRELADRMTEEDFAYMEQELASCTNFDPEGGEKFRPLKGEMELLFAGNYIESFQWLGFALKVQFFDFLDESELGTKLRNLIQTVKALQSQSTSTGQPKESPPASDTPAA